MQCSCLELCVCGKAQVVSAGEVEHTLAVHDNIGSIHAAGTGIGDEEVLERARLMPYFGHEQRGEKCCHAWQMWIPAVM